MNFANLAAVIMGLRAALEAVHVAVQTYEAVDPTSKHAAAIDTHLTSIASVVDSVTANAGAIVAIGQQVKAAATVEPVHPADG